MFNYKQTTNIVISNLYTVESFQVSFHVVVLIYNIFSINFRQNEKEKGDPPGIRR